MASLTLRTVKGSALTNAEVDANFSNLNTELGGKAVYPTQTDNNGKFLTTNGSTVSWATVDALPSQANNGGKYLTTNGSTASWSTISTGVFPFYKANGSSDPISLTSSAKLPFFNSSGVEVDIALAA